MTGSCLQIEELAGIVGLDDTDPRRRHLDHCPRCRALFATYREFLNGSPELADVEAEARLAEILDQEILGQETLGDPQGTELPTLERGQAAPEPAGVDSPVTRRRTDPITPVLEFLGSLARPRLLRPALALAAVLVVGSVLIQPWEHGPEPEIVLRGGESAMSEQVPTSLVARQLDAGGLVLTWNSVAEADAYRVEILSPSLAELADLEAGSESSLTLGASELAALREHSPVLVWRVLALREGDPIGHSRHGTLPRLHP